jgi:hypothetical protein
MNKKVSLKPTQLADRLQNVDKANDDKRKTSATDLIIEPCFNDFFTSIEPFVSHVMTTMFLTTGFVN